MVEAEPIETSEAGEESGIQQQAVVDLARVQTVENYQ